MAIGENHPKLRSIDIRPYVQDGHPYWLLSDPLALTDRMVLVPQELGPLLALCDGTRAADSLAAAFAVRCGARVRPALVRQLLDALDQALFLENGNYRRAHAAALAAYHGAPFRAPESAGVSYPEDAGALRSLLQEYVDAVADEEAGAEAPAGGRIRGLISPHIDYGRGGPAYARVWRAAAQAARHAELVLIFGTDHHGEPDTLTLTRQSYATPFGVLPAPQWAVERVAGALGEEAAFAGELHHIGEHSVELAAVWLHFIRDGHPVEMLPVLCGSLARVVAGGEELAQDPGMAAAIAALQEIAREKRTLVVAAADLSHVGPAFDGPAVNAAGRRRVHEADGELLGRICEGDAAGFLAAIRRVENANNVCGVAPIALAMQVLGETHGRAVAYSTCPADERGMSVVTVCGVVWE